jgi:hypothetical protein
MLHCIVGLLVLDVLKNRKFNTIPLPAWIGSEDSRKFRLPGLCVISGFRRTVNESCALLSCYAA